MQLNDIPKNDPMFRTPEGYFDTLPQKVARRVRKPEKEAFSLPALLRLTYAVPAMVVIIAVVTGIYQLQTVDNQMESLVSVEELLLENDISEDELWDYYVTQADENQDAVTMDELLYDISEDEFEQLIR